MIAVAKARTFHCSAITKGGVVYASHPVTAEFAGAAARDLAELIWELFGEKCDVVEVDGRRFGVSVSIDGDSREFISRALDA